MMVIPLSAIPAQQVNCNVDSQAVTLTVYQKTPGLFMDVAINDTPIITGVLCENANRIVRYAYRGLLGDFLFNDTQGSSDPTYDGLGSRYLLFFLSADEI